MQSGPGSTPRILSQVWQQSSEASRNVIQATIISVYTVLIYIYIYLDLQKAQNNGPILQNREYRKYRVHYFGHSGGPGIHTYIKCIHIYRYTLK